MHFYAIIIHIYMFKWVKWLQILMKLRLKEFCASKQRTVLNSVNINERGTHDKTW